MCWVLVFTSYIWIVIRVNCRVSARKLRSGCQFSMGNSTRSCTLPIYFMSKYLLYHRCLPDLRKLSDSRVGRSRSGKTDRFNMINRFINRFTERCLPMYECYSHSIIYVNVIQVFPDKFVEREILQLELHCPRFEKGCQWIGQLKHRQVL